ncbi:MAG TPA: TIGR02186 family protein [Xanthobacteraceae bacterium]
MMRLTRLAAAVAAFAAAAPAHAERLVVSLSAHRVLINSSFTGAEPVLFGAVERDAASATRRGGYDAVVTVTGPRQDVVTRQKERVVGIWVNAQSRTFLDVPSYLVVLTNRPLAAIASPDALQRLQIGIAQTPMVSDAADDPTTDAFRSAFLRLNREHGLYREEANAITFLTPNLFRAAIELPANAPIGNYEVDVKLFADGGLLTRQTSAIEIVKVGFEQFVASAAREHGFAYGLATATLALLAGWAGSIVFRRD